MDLPENSLLIHEQRGNYWRKSRYDKHGYIKRKWSNTYFGIGIRFFVCYWHKGKLLYRRDEQKTMFKWDNNTIYYKNKWPDIGWNELEKFLHKILVKIKNNFKSEYKFWENLSWEQYRNNKIDYQINRMPYGGTSYIPNNLYKIKKVQEDIEEEKDKESQLSLF